MIEKKVTNLIDTLLLVGIDVADELENTAKKKKKEEEEQHGLKIRELSMKRLGGMTDDGTVKS